MYCRKCGVQIPESNKFCQNCGTPITPENESVVKQAPVQQPPTTEQRRLNFLNGTKLNSPENKEKIDNILEKIKVFFKLRFVKFLKNYKNFKKLPKQSKTKHIMFPIIIVLVISLCANLGGGSTKGLNDSEAAAVLACSMLPSSVSSAVSIGAVDQVYFGSLSEYYKIISTEKKKTSEGYEITLNLEYDTYGHITTNKGTLVFQYNKESKTARLSGGSALNDLQLIAEEYAFN